MNRPHQQDVPAGHPLGHIRGVTPAVIQALEGRWITTAEQALGAAATPEGRLGLQRLTGLDTPALEALLAIFASVVGPADAAALSRPERSRALGVILPPDAKDHPADK